MTVLPALGTVSRAFGYTFCEHPLLWPIKEKVVGNPKDNFATLQDFESTVKQAISQLSTTSQQAEIFKEDFRLHMHGVKDDLCKSNRYYPPVPLPYTLFHIPSIHSNINFHRHPLPSTPNTLTHTISHAFSHAPSSPSHIPSHALLLTHTLSYTLSCTLSCTLFTLFMHLLLPSYTLPRTLIHPLAHHPYALPRTFITLPTGLGIPLLQGNDTSENAVYAPPPQP